MEIGWLLDDGLLCLGACFGGFKLVTYTDVSAIRFARKIDAESAIVGLKCLGFAHSHKFTAIEHGWGVVMLLTLEQAIARMEGFYAQNPSKNRPQRNHNPGDIEYGQFARLHGATSSDSRFAIFPDDATGFAALRALLNTPMYRILTIEQMVNKYAPPVENNVSNYLKSVCTWVGCLSIDSVGSILDREISNERTS